MALTPEQQRVRDTLRSEFMPDLKKKPEERVAAAIEYAAFHLGGINKKLAQLLEVMEKTERGALAVAISNENPGADPSLAPPQRPVQP